MPRVTLFFKGKVLNTHHLEQNDVTIGRDTNCTVTIDSLAVAPKHLVLKESSGTFTVTALDTEFPLLLNRKKIESATLKHGDLLQVGKHTLDFIDESAALAVPEAILNGAVSKSSDKQDEYEPELTGILQILSGSNIGRIIPLNQPLIRIGKSGETCAVIAYRDNGYYLSFLEGSSPPKVNQVSIGEQRQHLNDGDQIEIGGSLMYFQEETTGSTEN